MTAKTTSPSSRYLRPSLRGIILHCGGKIEETRTRFCDAMPASRRASSKDVSRSLCLPTPLVKKSFFGTILFPNFYVPSVGEKSGTAFSRSRMSLSHPGGCEQSFRDFHWRFILQGFRKGMHPPLTGPEVEHRTCARP